MKSLAAFVCVLLTASAVPATAQVSPQDVDAFVRQRCPEPARDLLKGFSDGNASASDVGDVCGCAAGKMSGRAVASETLLDRATAAALMACAKPVAIARSTAVMRAKFAGYLSQQRWSGRQEDAFAACAAERHWALSVDRGPADAGVTRSDVDALVRECSRVAMSVNR